MSENSRNPIVIKFTDYNDRSLTPLIEGVDFFTRKGIPVSTICLNKKTFDKFHEANTSLVDPSTKYSDHPVLGRMYGLTFVDNENLKDDEMKIVPEDHDPQKASEPETETAEQQIKRESKQERERIKRRIGQARERQKTRSISQVRKEGRSVHYVQAVVVDFIGRLAGALQKGRTGEWIEASRDLYAMSQELLETSDYIDENIIGYENFPEEPEAT